MYDNLSDRARGGEGGTTFATVMWKFRLAVTFCASWLFEQTILWLHVAAGGFVASFRRS